MNETATILIFSIVGVWFFTSPRFQAFKTVVMAPNKQTAQTPLTQSQLQKVWNDPSSLGGYRAGVVPIIPGHGVPGITTPIIPDNKLG